VSWVYLEAVLAVLAGLVAVWNVAGGRYAQALGAAVLAGFFGLEAMGVPTLARTRRAVEIWRGRR